MGSINKDLGSMGQTVKLLKNTIFLCCNDDQDYVTEKAGNDPLHTMADSKLS